MTSAAEEFFSCNICLDTASNPVLTRCGHLYCWPCLYRWMKARPLERLCPVCKVQLHETSIIPIYGRGRGETSPPRTPPKIMTPADCGHDSCDALPPTLLESPVPSRPSVVARTPVMTPVRTPTAPPARGAMDAVLPPGVDDSSGPVTDTLYSMLGLNLVFPGAGAEADLRALSPEQVRARSHPPRLSQQHRAPCSAVMRVCVPASAASTGLLVSLATHPWIVCYPLLAARLRRRGT